MHNLKIKIALFLNYALFALMLNSVGTVILQVQLTYGVSESAAAILEAFKDLSLAFSSFVVALLVMRIGYRNSIFMALIAVAVACIAMPFIPAFWMNKMVFAVIGVSFAFVKVSTYSAIGLITDSEKQHASLMSFIESFFMIGIFVSYFLFSAFVDDNNIQSTSWLDVYWVLAVMSLICIVALAIAPLDESGARQQSKAQSSVRDLKDMLALSLKPLVMIYITSAFLYALVEQGIMTWLPTFNSAVLNMPPSLSIQMASILAISFALGRFLAGVVLRWMDWFVLLACCLIAASVLVVVAMPLANSASNQVIDSWSNAPFAAFLFPMIGVCLAPIYPAIASVMLSALPKSQHAAMAGLIVIISALGGTTGSLITGNLFEHLGGEKAFYFSLIPMGLMVIALYFFKKQSLEHGQDYYQSDADSTLQQEAQV